MSIIGSLFVLLLLLMAGYALSRIGILSWSGAWDVVFKISLYSLLCSMGIRLGQSSTVLESLPQTGLLALIASLGTSAGTVLAHILCIPLYRRFDRLHTTSSPVVNPHQTEIKPPLSRAAEPGIMTLLRRFSLPAILFCFVLGGFFAGYVLPETPLLRDGSVSMWILYVLLFIIGIQTADSHEQLVSVLVNPVLLLIPLVTIMGSLSGSLVCMFFPGITPGKALALGAGFGWYSLSGVIITDMGEPLLGAAAFLANILRETIAFLAVPVLVYTRRRESGIGICGATSMDVTLPVLESTWGPTIVPLAVAHGVILSFLVPFLVPLCMSFLYN